MKHPKKLQLARVRGRRLKAAITVKRSRGAPPGNNNAFKHGRYAAARLALLAQIRAHIKIANALAESVHSNLLRHEGRVRQNANANEFKADAKCGSCEQKGIILAPRSAGRLIRPPRLRGRQQKK